MAARVVFRTLSNIYDGVFCGAVNIFREKNPSKIIESILKTLLVVLKMYWILKLKHSGFLLNSLSTNVLLHITNPLSTNVLLHRNLSIGLLSKSINWFIYMGTVVAHALIIYRKRS